MTKKQPRTMLENIKHIITLFIVFECAMNINGKPLYSTDLETALRNELFLGYEVQQRPSKSVDVNVSMTVFTVNGLNIKDQILSLSAYLTLTWEDSRLQWSDKSRTTLDYGNVPFLFSSEQFVWRPAIIIENSVKDISVISDANIPMRIANTGMITWNPSGIYQVSCDSDTTYYPLDYQLCTIVVTSWSYTVSEIKLAFPSDPMNMAYYAENGEWELISTSYQVGADRSRGGSSFASLEYQVKLRRRPLFHILNTLFPVSLMATLIAMVFRLPADSGEKIGFSLTVLLAYAVYLTLISDTIPSTSVNVCFLTVYLALTLGLGTIAVICTIIVLEVHFQPEEDEIPQWALTLVRDCMGKLVCWKAKNCCGRRKAHIEPVSEYQQRRNSIEKAPLPPDDEITKHEEEEARRKFTWKDTASVLDRFFFLSYIIIISVATFVLWSVIFAHHFN